MALAGFAGLKDYAALLIPEKFALTLTLSIFAIGLVVIKWRHGGVRETITKPHTANLFAPFLPADESSAEKQWPRYTEVEELRSLVSKSNLKHVSLVGETGVGKSTIISQLTTKLGPLNTIVFSNYSEISRGIVDGMFDLTPTAAKGALLTEKAMLIACIEEASK